MSNTRTDADAPAAVSRRTLATGLAWSVPVIATASAAPAFAASGCPTIAAVEAMMSAASDRITLTNNGLVAIPTGTTITWQIQDLSGTARTITIASQTGVTTTPTSFLLGANATATKTFTTNAAWASGATVRWNYTNGDMGVASWNYRSRMTVSGFPAPLSQCPSSSACTSVTGALTGNSCPSAAAPAAAPVLRSASGATSTAPDTPRMVG